MTGAARSLSARARSLGQIDLRWWLLIIGATVGLFQVFTIPPGLGIDEPAHFRRAWLISEGQFVAQHREGTAGGMIPECMSRFLVRPTLAALNPAPVPYSINFGDPPGCTNDKRWIGVGNTAPYSPTAYAPQALGVGAARLVHAPVDVTFYAGRLFGLATYLALCFAAIGMAPRGRPLLLVVSLLPMSLLSAGTYSIDSFLLGLTLVAVAAVLRSRQGDSPGTRWFWIATAALAGVALCKPPYLVLVPLLFLVPTTGFRSARAAHLSKACAAVVIGASAVLWGLASGQTRPLARPVAGALNIDVSDQIEWALGHPIPALFTFIRTFSFSDSANDLLTGAVGTWWHIRNPAAGSPTLPLWAVFAAVALIAAAYKSEWGPRIARTRRELLAGMLPVGLQAAALLAISGTLFLTYTPVGKAYVVGLQGRYFVPVVAVGIVSVSMLRAPRPVERKAWPFVVGVAALGLLTIAKTWIFYYGPIG